MANEEKSRITVEIHNKSYTIVGDEPREHMFQVADLVDQKMKEIRTSNRHLDTTRVAVLTAVNTMNDYLKLKEDYKKLLDSIKKED